MATVTARSLIVKIWRYWGYSSGGLAGEVHLRRIELRSEGETIQLPGYAKGGLFITSAAETFAGAVSTPTGAIWAAETLVSAAPEAGEPDHSPGSFNATYAYTGWYKWTAPMSGTVHIDTRGSFTSSGYEAGNDFAIQVYIGSQVDNLTVVTSSESLSPLFDNKNYAPTSGDDNYLSDEFTAAEGQEYMIAVAANDPANPVRINLAMFESYESFPCIGNNTGKRIFLPYSNKLGADVVAYNGLLSFSQPTFNSATGYPISKDYIQMVLVLGEELDFDEIAITNPPYPTDMGIREVQFLITDYPVMQADAENDTAPVPDEQLIYDSEQGVISEGDIPQNTTSEDFIVGSFDLSEKGLLVGIGIGADIDAGMNIEEAEFSAGIGIGCSAEAFVKPVAEMVCGLGIGMRTEGMDTYKPADVLAGIGIALDLEAETGVGAEINAGICVGCMLEGTEVPQNIINTAIGCGIKFETEQECSGKISCGIGIGMRISSTSGVALCRVHEFRDFEYF